MKPLYGANEGPLGCPLISHYEECHSASGIPFIVSN